MENELLLEVFGATPPVVVICLILAVLAGAVALCMRWLGRSVREERSADEVLRSATEQRSFKVLSVGTDPETHNKLGQREIEVIGAADAEQGYLMCFSEKPDAILLDSGLPGGQCDEALVRLREHPLLKDIPVIILSEEQTAETARQMSVLKGVKCLTKPIDVDELLGELGRHAASSPIARRSAPEAFDDVASGVTAEAPGADCDDPVDEATRLNWPKVLCIDDDPHVSRSR